VADQVGQGKIVLTKNICDNAKVTTTIARTGGIAAKDGERKNLRQPYMFTCWCYSPQWLEKQPSVSCE
jgi:hypothetical protein